MDPIERKAKLLGSLILFTKVFYKLRTGREFKLSQPHGRESHFKTISRALTKTQRGEFNHLLINVPPRYGKTELCIHYIAWCLARYPDSNFLYVSYSHSLAKKQTQTIRQIVSLPQYREIFGVELSRESSAKDNFETTAGGSVYAAGAGGTITGRGAGIQNCNRYGGAIIIDDIHKPSEVTSDTMRTTVKDWYLNTLQSRINNPQTPIIFIGQRLHEDDLAQNLMNGYDGHDWEQVILSALDENENALHPEMHDEEALLKMKDSMPYEFSAQYQQTPQPSGGGIFKEKWFQLLDEDPKILGTFITADTAETSKTHNDATVFSFWGIYKITIDDIETDLYGLHWLDCWELWCEPKDLKSNFIQFYSECMRYAVKPKLAAIEKKSTGTTLLSILDDSPGLQVIDLPHTVNKAHRFLSVQPYVAAKQVSFTRYAKHVSKCITHMKKITANDTHRYDDIADTMTDAIKIALIDNAIPIHYDRDKTSERTLATFSRDFNRRQKARFDTWR